MRLVRVSFPQLEPIKAATKQFYRGRFRDLATSFLVFCSNWKFAAYFHQIEEAELLLCLLSTEGSLWTQSPGYIALLESICACGMTDQHSPYDYPLSRGTDM